MDTITYNLTFSVNFFCKFGYSVYLVGDLPVLGSWNPASAIRLTWNEGNNWTTHLQLPCNRNEQIIQYKYITALTENPNAGAVDWEKGPNRIINLTSIAATACYAFVDTWDYRKIRLSLNDFFPKKKAFRNYQLILHGKLLEILEQKDPILLDLQKCSNNQKTHRNRAGEENRWIATFLLHATVSNFEYRYVFHDKSTGNIIFNRKITRTFRNPLHQTDGLILSANYQIIGSVVTKLDTASYENFIYDKILPNVVLGSSINIPAEVEFLKKEKIDHVLNLQTLEDINQHSVDPAGLSSAYKESQITANWHPVEERNIRKFVKGCRSAVELLKTAIETSKTVYLHCSYGVFRSVHTLVGYLVLHKNVPLNEVIAVIKKKRPLSIPSKDLTKAILGWKQAVTTRI